MYAKTTGIKPENVSGIKDGYSYDLKQILPQTRTFLYTLTDPTGASNILELDGEGVEAMVKNPKAIWDVTSKTNR